MLFMVIEHFKNRDAKAIYQRAAALPSSINPRKQQQEQPHVAFLFFAGHHL